ncbi:50S ribosomal protein L17 [Candidatus Campbellbacteria bacterium CG22_combo_CG10-13_8_21_14_all_36_13]|uniref:Large ribosomal subunit protein bL17 n=1 Tax=Candidatus Campbellbacteria bacterium CG22_combo_CG10-13_8_21_14_all_36_13 TaxID=1974529 RepID=A0A2H0DYL1_9BACT|nr:MAG: 50S ribosomal protein L17 [Candidatus Campbellbacteria bacterium CG22_combo_CG10-13_8_21_14_all_36_13]
MKHGIKQRKFGRVTKQRTALLRSLAISLIKHEKIETTEAKAKELRPYVEKLITRAKTNSVFSHRILMSRIGGSNKDVVSKLIKEIGPRYIDRKGGYTRITKITHRASDASKMAIIELV